MEPAKYIPVAVKVPEPAEPEMPSFGRATDPQTGEIYEDEQEF